MAAFGLGNLAATGLVTLDFSGNAETAFGQARLKFPFN